MQATNFHTYIFLFQIPISHCYDLKLLDGQVWTNSADPDQSDKGLHCLLFFLTHLCLNLECLQQN